MPVDEVRKLINAIDNSKTEFNSPPFTPFISKRLRKLVGISEPIDEKKSINKLQHKHEQMNDELKQQMRNELQQQIKNKNKQTMDKLKEMNEELKQTKGEVHLLQQQMKHIRDELKQTRDEFKQTKNELIKDIRELLTNFVIKNSDASNDVKK